MLQFNVNYFYSTISDGNMNTAAQFYKEGMSKEEIKQDFTKRRIKLGKEYGFDGLKIITPIQKVLPNLEGKTEEEKVQLMERYGSKYKDGYSVRITKEMVDAYPDLYDLDIYADILMIGKELPEIALAYPVADCPVVLVEDTKAQVTAMAHCGGEYIDRELPFQMIDAIRQETDAKIDDLRVYVGPHAQKENFTYNRIPVWMHHLNVWSRAIVERKGYFHIDMETAIRNQMRKQGIEDANVIVSPLDTISDSRFYSNNQARFHLEKVGRFYTGCFYSGEISEKTKKKFI